MNHEEKNSSDNSFHPLQQFFFSLACRNLPRFEYFCEVSRLLLPAFACDQVDVWLKEDGKFNHLKIFANGDYNFSLDDETDVMAAEVISQTERVNEEAFQKNRMREGLENPAFGSRWTGSFPENNFRAHPINSETDHGSYVLIPLAIGTEKVGFLKLFSKKADFFTAEKMARFEQTAQTLAMTFINQKVQAALRERVKELTCLYTISQIAEERKLTLDDVLQRIVVLLPPAWQYPEITEARIVLDSKQFTCSGFMDRGQKQTADIIIKDRNRGFVQVVYRSRKPEIGEGPFLREERSLIDTIAREVASIVERCEAEQDQLIMQEQLRHADRLATIGQLAAGVAHELNEPLGNILGFAQLIEKNTDLPLQALKDIRKIISSSLHAREIIKKLLLFARQMPSISGKVNLNKVVEDGLYFFEARCAKLGILLLRQPAYNLPLIIGDGSQLNQVLVNLVVNSIQAMPSGGKLIIKTLADQDHVSLIVEDTGIGMSVDILGRIFIPFFTTKDVNEGTGLGLAVVHGIVTAHKGKINVESEVNAGSRFEVMFPVAVD